HMVNSRKQKGPARLFVRRTISARRPSSDDAARLGFQNRDLTYQDDRIVLRNDVERAVDIGERGRREPLRCGFGDRARGEESHQRGERGYQELNKFPSENELGPAA